MIPDFPQEKEKLMQYWLKYLGSKNKELMGFFGKLPSYANHEGHQWKLIRSDGSQSDQPYHEIQAIFQVEIKEVPNLTPEKIRMKLDNIAEELSKQISRNIFDEISKATREVGNDVDVHGEPLTQEHFLQTLEKIDLDFDEGGNWKPPTIIMHPNLWAAKKDEFKLWETDEEFLAKQKELIARKKEEWCGREINRKLVD